MNREKRDIRMVFSIFSLLFILLAWKYYPSVLSYLLIGLSLCLISLVVFFPLTLRPLFKGWLKIAHLIGRFNTQVLLSLMFVTVFIPVGIIMRMVGKDPMKRRTNDEGSYWESYSLEGLKDKSRYKRQF
jgi:hypothetical protein